MKWWYSDVNVREQGMVNPLHGFSDSFVYHNLLDVYIWEALLVWTLDGLAVSVDDILNKKRNKSFHNMLKTWQHSRVFVIISHNSHRLRYYDHIWRKRFWRGLWCCYHVHEWGYIKHFDLLKVFLNAVINYFLIANHLFSNVSLFCECFVRTIEFQISVGGEVH